MTLSAFHVKKSSKIVGTLGPSFTELQVKHAVYIVHFESTFGKQYFYEEG